MRKKVLVGVSGSVAAVKVPELVQQLKAASECEVSSVLRSQTLCEVSGRGQIDVQVVCTRAAQHFFNATDLSVACHKDEDEWVSEHCNSPSSHVILLSSDLVTDRRSCTPY